MSTQMKEESLKLQNEIDLTKKYLVDVTGNLENTTQELNTKKEEVEVLNEKVSWVAKFVFYSIANHIFFYVKF